MGRINMLFLVMGIFFLFESALAKQLAAPPGYLGKRNSLLAQTSISPFSGLDFAFAFNKTISAKTFLQLKFLRTNFEVIKVNEQPIFGQPLMLTLINGNAVKRISSTNFEFTIGFQKSQSFVAPIGYYTGQTGSIMALRLNGHDEFGNSAYLDNIIELGVGYQLGNRRCIAKNLMLDVSVDLNLYFTSVAVFFIDDDSIIEEAKIKARKRNFYNSLFKVNLGLHYLF